MAVVLGEPGVDGLGEVVGVLRDWQDDGAPFQLHPGDVGWFWRFGAEATAAAVRTWRRDGRILAVGLLDGPGLLRLTSAPEAQRDEELARRLVEDVTEPGRGVLPEGKAYVEAPNGALIQELLSENGWHAGEPWTPLHRDLTEPVKDPGVRVEAIGPERAHVWSAVLRASFDGSTFTGERWHAMAAGLPYADARCLLAYDGQGDAVAAVTVWSAGPASPGCSSRWACTGTIAATATARRSPSPRRPHSGNWARRARSSAPRAPTPAPSPPTSQPVSSHSPRDGTCTGTPSASRGSPCLTTSHAVDPPRSGSGPVVCETITSNPVEKIVAGRLSRQTGRLRLPGRPASRRRPAGWPGTTPPPAPARSAAVWPPSCSGAPATTDIPN
nr:hypothetical protein [Thermoactinospora rubra]